MKRRFVVKPLTPDRVDATFPVAQAAVPGLTIERWRQFAADAALASPGESATAPGILVVESERGHVQGFCTYRLQHDIRHGSVLAVNDLVALDLIDDGAIGAAMVDALETRARQFGCGAVRLQLSDTALANPGGPTLCEILKRIGRPSDAIRLVRPVDLSLD